MRKRTLFSPGAFLSKKWPIYFHKGLKERKGKIVRFSYVIPVIIFKGFLLSFKFFKYSLVSLFTSGYIYINLSMKTF